MIFKRTATAAIFAASCTFGPAGARTTTPSPEPLIVPAGTKMTVSVTEPVISNVAKAGDAFAFVTNADTVVNGTVVVRKGTIGSGTVAFAGAAGGHGHEGNLHLVFDRIATTLNAPLTIGVENEFSGHKQRILGLISGVTVLGGFGAAVRGGQAVVVPDQPISLVLKNDVCIDPAGGARCPQHP